MPWWGSKIEDVDTCSGHIGDLSDGQALVLEEFKKAIHDENITNDPRFDDYYLLRFCRARKFQLENVLEMFKTFIKWRNREEVNQAMVLYKGPNMPEVKKIYQHGYHATDREGRPFYIDRPCQFMIDDLFALASKEEIIQYYVRESEKFIHLRLPAASKAVGHRIERSFSVIDIEGFSIGHLKENAREFMKLPMKITQNYYPESMHKLMVVNAPFVFKGAWSVIKSFIDEKTRQKISILGSNFHEELFENVDPDNVPKLLGGNGDCSQYVDTSKVQPDSIGSYCFSADRGPWNDYPGDEYSEVAKEKAQKGGCKVEEFKFISSEDITTYAEAALNPHQIHIETVEIGKDQKPTFTKFASKYINDDAPIENECEQDGFIKLNISDF